MFRSSQGKQQRPASTKPKRGKLLGRGKNSASNNTYHRLSPLKEHSPSKPKPPPPQQMMPRKGNYGKNIQRNNTDSHRNNNNASVPPSSLGFSQAELVELQESFQMFDIEGSGSIAVGDLGSILKTLQQESRSDGGAMQFPHLSTLLQRLSQHYNDDDLLTLQDYIDLMASTSISSAMASNEVGDGDNFAHVFQLFDTDGKGYITIQDLERVAAELGEHDMTREELEDMIQRAKQQGPSASGGKHPQQNNRVGLHEFTRVMTMNLFPRAASATEQA